MPIDRQSGAAPTHRAPLNYNTNKYENQAIKMHKNNRQDLVILPIDNIGHKSE